MRRHSTATLMGMTKAELVDYVRMAEHNQDVAEETLNQQAENVKDWVPVVRCKDCKYYTGSKNRCDHPCMDWDIECYDQWLEVSPDDFCSYGERRTDNA